MNSNIEDGIKLNIRQIETNIGNISISEETNVIINNKHDNSDESFRNLFKAILLNDSLAISTYFDTLVNVKLLYNHLKKYIKVKLDLPKDIWDLNISDEKKDVLCILASISKDVYDLASDEQFDAFFNRVPTACCRFFLENPTEFEKYFDNSTEGIFSADDLEGVEEYFDEDDEEDDNE